MASLFASKSFLQNKNKSIKREDKSKLVLKLGHLGIFMFSEYISMVYYTVHILHSV